MTKSAKAKKAKKADFAKVKLKVGRTLKKAQNETRTDFKARKIIVKEQLSQKTDQTLLTKKKHNVMELTTRLRHTNTYVRQDGVNGLLELVKSKECGDLLSYLSVMVPAVAPCIFDSDSLIRTATLKFFEALIGKVGVYLEPYLNIVATHLSCAMVHLNMHIQGDSLKFMNVLVTRCPGLIARHSDTLLTNFINLISRKANSGASKGVTKGAWSVDFSRMLQNSPGNTMTSQKWRVKLLQELSGFMAAVMSEQARVQHHIPITMWQTVVAGSLAPVSTCKGGEGGGGGGGGGGSGHQVSLFSDPHQLEAFLHTIVPLLFQIWAEVEPEHTSNAKGSSLLSEEAVETLKCIVSIISQLWNTNRTHTQDSTTRQRTDSLAQLTSKYMSKIMRWFPCYCIVTAPTQKKNKGIDEQENFGLRHCDDLNVSLAALALQLSPSQDLHTNTANFLAKLLLDGNRDGQYRMSSVVDAMLVLLSPSTTLPSTSTSFKSTPTRKPTQLPTLPNSTLLAAAHTCYARLHPRKKDRTHLLRVLLAATDLDNRELWQCSSIECWVKELVTELSEGEVKQEMVETAIILRLKNNTPFTILLSQCGDQVKDNMSRKGVTGWTDHQLNLKLNLLIKE